jgi:hypothetical protein
MSELVYKPLPRGYSCAAEEPPPEREPRCLCGHLFEDHFDRDELLSDPSALLDALYEIDHSCDPAQDVPRILDRVLPVCLARGCTCREFEEMKE